MEGIKAGSAYFEIYAKAERLKAQMADWTGLVKKTAENFEEAFRNAKLDIDNRVLTMKFSQLQGLHKALLKQLEQKIKLDADVASIEKTRIALKSVEDALGKTSGGMNKSNGAGLAFNRMIQDSAYVTQGWGFWLTSVGNNITNFAEQMQYGAGRGLGFKAMLGSMFTGMNAWVMAISAGVTLLTIFANSNKDSGKEVEDHTKKIKDQIEALKELSRVKLNQDIGTLEDEVNLLKKRRDLEKERFELGQKAIQQNAGYGGGITDKGFVFSRQSELDEKMKILMASQAMLANKGKEEDAEARINELIKKRKALIDDGNGSYKKQVESINAQIAGYQKVIDANKENSKSLAKTEAKALEDRIKENNEFAKELLTQDEAIAELKKNNLEKYYETVKFRDVDYFQWKSDNIVREVATEAWKNEQLKKLVDERAEYERDKTTSKGLQGLTAEDYFNSISGGSHIRNPRQKEKEREKTTKDIFKEFVGETELANEAYDTMFSSIMNGFDMIRIKAATNANDTTRFWVNMGNEVMAMMERMIAKWALLNLISFARGKGGFNFFDMLLGEKSIVSTGTDISSVPSFQAPTYSMQNNFNDRLIVERLDRLIGSVQSQTVNLIKEKSRSSQRSSGDILKQLATLITEEQHHMIRGNIKTGWINYNG